MNNSWTPIMVFPYLSLCLLLASFVKAKVPFIKRLVLPSAILAGFIGLILGPDLLGILPFDRQILGNLVYHAMAIGFIALSLKPKSKKSSPKILKSGFLIVSIYMLQGLIGIVLSLILMNTLYPNIFGGFGLLLPLGFGQGPGQAYSMGSQWELLGFVNGGQLGLVIATIGFLWAIVFGLPVMNRYVRKKASETQLPPARLYEKKPLHSKGLSLDSFTRQIVLIGLIYFLTYLSIRGLERLILPLGSFGQTFVSVLWGMQFNIGAGYALLFRFLLDKALDKKHIKEDLTDAYLLDAISATVFDFMIAASIAAITLSTITHYLLPVLLMTSLGGVITLLYLNLLAKRIYPDYPFENLIGFFGMLTGTISTGMALIKSIDPKLETDAANNLVFGSAVGMAFGTPLLVIINLPIMAYTEDQPQLYALTLLTLALYFLVLLGLILRQPKTHFQTQASSKVES